MTRLICRISVFLRLIFDGSLISASQCDKGKYWGYADARYNYCGDYNRPEW